MGEKYTQKSHVHISAYFNIDHDRNAAK